jgi:arginyl-tRNA synthetase
VITDRLSELVVSALEKAVADGVLASPDAWSVTFVRPRRREHGDWATNVALGVTRGEGNPRRIGEEIAARLPENDLVARVEVAGPGFLNFHLSPTWLHDVVRRAADPAAGFGRDPGSAGERVNVEYVSSNPTGPINVVSGRHAAVGDALANLLEAAGHQVTKEFYWNDEGRQTELFGDSIAARYLMHFGEVAELPEDGYKGEYVAEIASEIAAEVGDRYLHAEPDERARVMRQMGLDRMLEAARLSLARFGTSFDVWTKESALHASGAVTKGLDQLRAGDWVYEKDGALFFRSSDLGDDKDRVAVRASGQPTYLAGDIAYLSNKFDRGFDRLIYLWGADHHGTVPRLLAAAEALGYDRDRVEVPIVQMVTLSRGGEAVRASKRAGIIVPLDELIDEVGVDAARYTFLTRSVDASLDFDIELAKEEAAENPVYYVQYAHARISSILRKAAEADRRPDPPSAPLERLGHPSEDELMRKLASYEEVVPEAAELRAPQRITRYVEELASTFSAFYRDCRVVSDDVELTAARLALCSAAKAVIEDALGLLGVSSPERM